MTFPRDGGFSLVELAIVLVIVALLSTGAITAMRVQTDRSRLLETRAQLNEAKEALINWAAVKGELPCPDTSGDGEPETCGSAGVLRGRVPWHLLALPSTDPWGQALHYAVHANFVKAGNFKLSNVSNLEIQGKASDGTYISLANGESVAIALWSSGANATDNSAGETAGKVLAESPDSDDIVTWLSRFVLLGRMLEAGRDIPQ